MLTPHTATELAVIAQAEFTSLENEIARLKAQIHTEGNRVQTLIAEEVIEAQKRTARNCLEIFGCMTSRHLIKETIKERYGLK